MKTIAFATHTKSIVPNPTLTKVNCLFCDKPAWISDAGGFSYEPTKIINPKDIKIDKMIGKECFEDVCENYLQGIAAQRKYVEQMERES